ncbi:MAG: DUF4258 domain-containing protein [Candidatus Scalindua sp.]|nr:DUF4258 domain-containing protein [Candidatus Scalindua sp.]
MKQKVISAANKHILFLPHAIKQMSRPDRMITTDEVHKTILHGEVIEEYTDDPRGESCLIFHTPSKRPVHVVSAPRADYLVIVTAYLPEPNQWSTDFKTRR